jgi:epoxyqueuosine reductase
MKHRMRNFVQSLESELDLAVAAKWYVDDGPMLDRAAANRAGIGWFGKNTNILTPSFGSWVFLGQVITDLELEPDAPLKKSCGSCVRCIADCPTGALVAPYVLDNARCISYQTIENRGAIPRDLRPLMQDWVFGCDICQDVCPVNRKAREAGQPIPLPDPAGGADSGRAAGMGFLDLAELLKMSEEDFRTRFAGTSIMRAKRVGMQRNACVVLGNSGDDSAVPALRRALVKGEPMVRGHAAWALGRIGGPDAAEALAQAASLEADPEVLEEIAAAGLELAGS